MEAPNNTAMSAENIAAVKAVTDNPRAMLLMSVDDAVQSSKLNAEQQAGVLFAACALAVRRLIEANDTGNSERNRVIRHKVRKAAVAEFESKLRTYCTPLTGG